MSTEKKSTLVTGVYVEKQARGVGVTPLGTLALRWAEAKDDKDRFQTAGLAGVYVIEHKVPRSQWTWLEVLGLWIVEWGKHYGTPRRTGLLTAASEVRTIVNWLGVEDASYAVEALFLPDMEWVKDKTLNFITQENYENRLLSTVRKMKAGGALGEQSEFGPTDRAKRSTRIL